VNVALGRQDRLTAALLESRIGDAVELGHESGGVVPALVTQDRLAILVREHQVCERTAGDPGLLGDLGQLLALLKRVGEDEVDDRNIEFVNESGHAHQPSLRRDRRLSRQH